MKVSFVPGALVCAKGTNRNNSKEVATVLRYEGEGFYVVRTPRGELVCDEDDLELVVHDDCDNRGGACCACRWLGL